MPIRTPYARPFQNSAQARRIIYPGLHLKPILNPHPGSLVPSLLDIFALVAWSSHARGFLFAACPWLTWFRLAMLEIPSNPFQH